METNREIVRKKWEEFMKNPLAKELWVTDPKNFDNPVYKPTLRLVIDSDDYTILDVDEFEDLYSDEEVNYWNGVIREPRNFNPEDTGIRDLVCVYKDGRWL